MGLKMQKLYDQARPFLFLQWGLEYRKLENRIYSKTERF